MKKKSSNRIILSLMILSFLAAGLGGIGIFPVKAEEMTDNTQTSSGAAVEIQPTATPEATQPPIPTPTMDVNRLSLNKKNLVLMAKKKYKLVLTGTLETITYTSLNTKVATVGADGVIKGVAPGTTTIQAAVGGVSLSCSVRVVSKMVKKDFGKFNGENFVSFCTRKGYNRGYAWVGQWKGDSKKKSTYRGIKIGASTKKVTNAYGYFKLKKCSSKDPFTKMKGLKKNKVKTYTDMTYGKYRIRFYFNSKKKVVATIYSCNLSKIKKSALKRYI